MVDIVADVKQYLDVVHLSWFYEVTESSSWTELPIFNSQSLEHFLITINISDVDLCKLNQTDASVDAEKHVLFRSYWDERVNISDVVNGWRHIKQTRRWATALG